MRRSTTSGGIGSSSQAYETGVSRSREPIPTVCASAPSYASNNIGTRRNSHRFSVFTHATSRAMSMLHELTK